MLVKFILMYYLLFKLEIYNIDGQYCRENNGKFLIRDDVGSV